MLYSSAGMPTCGTEIVTTQTALDGRTTRHPGYAVSQIIRKRVEEPFGWGKVIGGLRKLHHRGVALVDSCFALTMTGYNLIRMTNLMPELAIS